ncbi:MAG: D-alanyl-D-alanine carboxypeptidase [Bacteroidota bacterium]
MLNPIIGSFQVFFNQQLRSKTIRIVLPFSLIAGCASLPSKPIKKEIFRDFQSEKFKSQHTGFLVVDLTSNDTLMNLNGAKYFTPASTAKLFTLYSSLALLGDSLPSLKYTAKNNTLTAIGTGDPSWLHPHFKNEIPINFIAQYDSVAFFLDNYAGDRFGPGWAWEDYPYYFSPEISPLPLYGNVITVEVNDSLKVTPNFFSKRIQRQNAMPLRGWKHNQFYLPDITQDTLYVPYITSKKLTLKLLHSVIEGKVRLLDSLPLKNWKMLPGIPRDSVLKRMLWQSDNFLAEQLMLTCSSTLSDTLSFEKAKNRIMDNHLSTLRQKPRWVDGSGLSRYNLFTPESMVTVLQRLYSETDSLRLFSLVPQWDFNGTITMENSSDAAFIHAKSGSMGNIYNLCGYLRTTSGRLFAFSFMNNHFRRPSKEVRRDMYAILKLIHERY